MPDEPYLLIPLRRRDGTIRAHAIIDESDAALAEARWCQLPSGYVTRQTTVDGVKRTLYLHRVVLGLSLGDGLQGDHENGNRLDCRRSNLRVGTHALNGQNIQRVGGTSAHRGVSWDKRKRKWRADVRLNGRQASLGYFDDEQKAADVARAYRLAHLPFTNEERNDAGLH